MVEGVGVLLCAPAPASATRERRDDLKERAETPPKAEIRSLTNTHIISDI